MAQTMGVLLLLVGSSLLKTASAQAGNSTYTILAPKALRPSSVYNVTATCFNVVADVTLTLRIQGADNRTLVETQTVLANGVQQIVSLQIPSVLRDENYVLVALGAGGLVFYDSASISVKRKTLSIFVQTDKPMYKPGQTVLFRAVVLYPDLKPYKGFIDIEIFDLAGNKIMQWLHQKNNSGVIAQSLPLSEQTPLGDWKIVVKAEENSVDKTFQVAEYVLPKFEVKVMLPSFLLINLNRRDRQEDLSITVIAKYTYGQPVKGRANATVQMQPYHMYDQTNYPKLSFDVQLTEGKADLTLTSRDLEALVPATDQRYGYYISGDPMNRLSSSSLLVVADVNETVTGKVLSGNGTVKCTSNKYSLKFSSFTPSNYKPGLMFTAYMELKKTDGTNPDTKDIKQSNGEHAKILVTAVMRSGNPYDRYGYDHSSSTYNEQFNVTIDPSGYISFSILIKDNVTRVDFEARFYVEATNLTVAEYKTIEVFKSRDKQAIQVAFNSNDGIIKAQQQNTFDVSSNEPLETFQYAILSKGSVQLSGTVVGDPSTKHSFSVFVSKDLAMKLNPSARIVAWFVTEYGEIVADSVELTVGDGFGNEVSLSFDRNATTPSEDVALTVKADVGSNVFVLALDQSVLLLKSGNDITENMITSDLKQYDSKPNDYYEPWMGAIDRRRKRSIFWCPIFIGGEDTQSILSNAGVIMLTNAFVYKHRFEYPRYYEDGDGVLPDGAMAAPAAPDIRRNDDAGPSPAGSSERTRTEFPETWLWMDAVTGPDGSVSLRTRAPDTITSWVASAFAISPSAGIGVAPENAKLTVFKQFFLSPNLPYSIIRGEEFALQVTVFNYLSTPLKVKVSVEPSNYFVVKGESSVMTEVESNDAVSVYFWIVAGALGQIPINIKGVSPVAADSLIVKLLVKPEGVQRQYSTSVFIQLPPSNPEFNTTLEVSLPPVGQLVSGSEHIEATAIGDIMGPSVKGLAALLQMPYGCGEQNMLTFAPDVFIVKYLSFSNQLTADIEAKALGFMNAGYQRELTYQRTDGSFSAFGNSDDCGSIWLSAFVIKCFHQAKDYIPIDDSKIAKTMKWIIEQQGDSGSFAEPPNGRVIHVDMQGGSSKGLSLAAYVLIALLENRNNSGVKQKDISDSVEAARHYLESQIHAVSSDPYALAILSYALVKANSERVNEVLQKLEAIAIVEAGTKHWEKASDEKDESSESQMWRPPYSQARAVNIEMSAYVLLTYCEQKDLSKSLPIAKWIIAQRNANGGFSSTQDTVVALEALTAFAMMTSAPPGELSVLITVSTDNVQHSFQPIVTATSILFQSFQLPSDSKRVYVNARGKGSALVQLNAKYNIYKTENISGIDLEVDTKQKGNSIIIKSCSSWKKKEGSGMVVMEINQLTGFQASNVDDLKKQNDVIKRVETSDEKVVLYLDELTSSKTCVSLTSAKVFAVSNVQDAPVKVYSYYDPSGERVQLYSAPQALGQNSPCSECPQCCSTDGTFSTRSFAGKMFSTLNPSSLVVLATFVVFIQSCFARIQ